MPRFSGDQACQAVEDDAKDRLIGGARRQVDLDLLFQFDGAGGDLDEAQPQSVELHDAPGRAFGHQPAHRPEEPVRARPQIIESTLIELYIGFTTMFDTVCCGGDRYRTDQGAVFGGGAVSR